MQGSFAEQRMGSRVVGGVIAMIGAITAVSIYAFYRVDRVQENVEVVNQFYVPVLKHLNVLTGKWSAYQRSFEQTVSFRKWGATGSDNPEPKIHLKKLVEPNVKELLRRAEGRVLPETEELRSWTKSLEELSGREPLTVAELESLLKNKQYADAAAVYAHARAEHLKIGQELSILSRDIENRLVFLQVSTEQELRNSQNIFLLLLGVSLVFSLLVLFRIRRWFLPVSEWTRVAQEIALKGISRDIKFPQVKSGMPAELALLTVEFTRMGTTVLEREKTIFQQTQKLEQLNQNLKEQNVELRRLGNLNDRVLNNMSSGLLVVNKEGLIEQFNNRYAELFKGDRTSLIGSPNPWVAKDIVDRSRIQLGHRSFDVRVQPFGDQEGKVLLFEDVTQMIETEAKLEHAKKLVLAGNLSSQVAHEIRNPLNSMSLQLEMLKEDASDERLRARAEAIAEQVDRLDRITRRYLDVGRAVLNRKENLNIHSKIEKCLLFLSREIQSARVLVKTKLDAKSCNVCADGDAIEQVIFNLVRNAIEAMREEPPLRTLEIASENAGGFIRIQVSDTGPGISGNLAHRVFEPFVTNKADGHGLGLSVSRQICIEHGGDLKLVKSEKGATFEISIPLVTLPKKENLNHAPHPHR